MEKGQKKFHVLSEVQCGRMVDAALHILEQTGVIIKLEEARELLKTAGGRVEGERVYLPRQIVMKAVDQAPSSIKLFDRVGKPTLILEGTRSYFGPGPTCVFFKDVETGKRRKATKQDVANTAIVSDHLENIDFVMGLGMISDQMDTLADIHEFHALLTNTTKPLITWAFNDRNLKTILDMGALVTGGMEALREKPFFAVYTMPVTPLTHPEDSLRKLLLAASQGIPQIYSPGGLFGGTSPVTPAGTLAIGIADCLTGLTIAQLKRPGTPVICASLAGGVDFKTMQGGYAEPLSMMQGMGSADVFRWLELPFWSVAGCTDAKTIDGQAVLDATLQIFSHALIGGHLVHDLGMTDSGMTGNLDYLVVCNEIIARVRRLMYGFDVDENSVPLDLIDEVGPSGSYLRTQHTLKNFRKEMTFSDLYEQRSYEDWEKEGQKTIEDRANEKVRRILAEHKPQPLSEQILASLERLVQDGAQNRSVNE